jgi:hypothetical protein
LADQGFIPRRANAQAPVSGPWEAEEICLLHDWYPLVHEGKATARQIANFLDRTRNSVIAQANRCGLCERKPR